MGTTLLSHDSFSCAHTALALRSLAWLICSTKAMAKPSLNPLKKFVEMTQADLNGLSTGQCGALEEYLPLCSSFTDEQCNSRARPLPAKR